MSHFTFETTPRLVCQDGASERLAEFAGDLGVRHALVVTDRGLRANGVVDHAITLCRSAGVAVTVFDGVEADPPEASIHAALEVAQRAGADGVIGFGGGSSLDTAKLVAFLARSTHALSDIYGVERAKGPRLPLIQVPTTAGTGSEVTPIAIVTTPTNEKMGVVARALYADIAVLDATLTLGLPARVSAMTGIDAMVHAIEAYTSRHKKNLMSDSLALRALILLSENLRYVLEDGRDLPARRAMLQGAMLAGMAFANAPVAAVHALAYPLGGHYHIPHGHSNALVLMPVLHFNAPAASMQYAELSRALRRDAQPACAEFSEEGFLRAMEELVRDLGIETRLREVGVPEEALPMLASDAMKVERLLVNNPRDVAYDDALALYREAW